jgi:hypothetical protein
MGAAKHHHSTRIGTELLPNKISRETAKESALLVRSNLPATPLQLQRRTLQRKLQSSIHSSFDFLSTPFKARSIPSRFNSLSIPYRWQLAGEDDRASCLLPLANAVALSLRNRNRKSKQTAVARVQILRLRVHCLHPSMSEAIGSGV